jgi:branched-chain amino acid transport system substrate-binding protein
MKRVLALLATAVVALTVLTGFSTREQAFRGTVYLGMDTPLTGPQAIVGQGDREAVLKLVRYWNNRGGIKGRRVVVDVLDNASNPSQAVQNVQRFVNDSKYVGILGSGNAAAAVATAPLATSGRIPFLALSPPTPLVAPPRPYVYVALPTSRLYAYSMAQYLKSLGVTRIALMGDNGGFGRDGVGQVQALAKAFGFTITDDVIFAPTSTSFTAELTKVRNSNAQALWIWTVTPAASTIVKEFRQLRLSQRLVLTGGNLSPQFLQGTCPDVNGALVNSFLGPVWDQLPKTNPNRRQGAILRQVIGRPPSVFHVDTATSLWALKAAMERGGFTRQGINTALETKIRGLPTPGGRLYFGPRNHSGIQIGSMWAGRIASCKPVAVFGAAFKK